MLNRVIQNGGVLRSTNSSEMRHFRNSSEINCIYESEEVRVIQDEPETVFLPPSVNVPGQWILFTFEIFILSFASQKIVWSPFSHVWLSSSRRGIEDQEVIIHLLIHLHYTSFVAASVAVIWCGENCHDSFVMTPVVPVHNQLMGSWYQFKIICVIEILGYVLSKSKTSSSGRDTPTMAIIWVRPKEIAHWTLVRNFDLSVNLSDLLESV